MTANLTYDELVKNLASSDVSVVRDAAHALGDAGDPRAVEPLIELLRTSTKPTAWNAAAVGLRELKNPRAVEPLVERIRDPRTAGSRGTLVWALEVFDCAPYIEMLVDLVINDNYEVARNAAAAIVSIESDIDTVVWNRCIATLEAALPTANEERTDVLQKLLARFASD